MHRSYIKKAGRAINSTSLLAQVVGPVRVVVAAGYLTQRILPGGVALVELRRLINAFVQYLFYSAFIFAVVQAPLRTCAYILLSP